MEELVELLSTKDSNGRLSSSITPILVHEFPDLAYLPLLANERHPAIGHKAVHQETDAPAEQRPECLIDARGGHEVDKVQKQLLLVEEHVRSVSPRAVLEQRQLLLAD